MTYTVSIINYGLGNIRSVEKAVLNLGHKAKVISYPKDLEDYEKIILPGVGSFKNAMHLLNSQGWTEEIKKNVIEKKKNIFGICLGMQLLGSSSEEFGYSEGFNFIKGKIKYLNTLGCKEKLPQIGWNSIQIKKEHEYLKNIETNTDFYFVNSLVFDTEEISTIIAESTYGAKFTSIIAKDNIFGTQFHPEKSSKAGLKILENFLNA